MAMRRPEETHRCLAKYAKHREEQHEVEHKSVFTFPVTIVLLQMEHQRF